MQEKYHAIPTIMTTHSTSKAAIITGAGHRIGSFLALALAEVGFDIFLHYNHARKEAENIKEQIEHKMRQRCILHKCDLTDQQNALELVKIAFNSFSYCNALINNASTFHKSNFANTSIDNLDTSIDLNLKAPFLLSQEFSKRCMHGHIVNMLDSAIKNPGHLVEHFAYKIGKKSLEYLSEMLSIELAGRINVHKVYLGIVLQPTENTENEKIISLCKKIIMLLNSTKNQEIIVD